MVKIAGFGNPLLDISVKVNDNELLNKYGFLEDEQYEFNKEKMIYLLKDIEKYDVTHSPGGSVQNTMRILQWLINVPDSTHMFGGIGNDEQGRNLKNIIETSGVKTHYTVFDEKLTGTVVSIIKDRFRSLVAYIGASESIKVTDIESEEKQDVLKDVNYVYMEGFFVTQRADVARYVQKFCEENKKTFILSLSAPYVIKENSQVIVELAKKCDILFGNKREFAALKDAMNFEGTSKELTLHLLESYDNKLRNKFGKMVIATNGSNWVVCGHSGKLLERLPVPKLDEKEIVDTNGAGDAFSAGFLAGIFMGKMPIESMKIGFWTAAEIIKKVGCILPDCKISIKDVLKE